MNLSSNSRAGLLLVATLGAVWAAACSDDDGPNGINELGGSTYGGGVSPSSTAGGSSNVGGASVVQGGTVGNGGSSVVNSAGSGATPTSGGTTMAGGSSSVGGASSAGAPTAGAGGGTAACGTTKGTFAPYSLTVTTSSTLQTLDGFVKSGNNANQVVDVVTSPALCADGCLRMSGTYSPSDGIYSGTVAIQKPLTGESANLLGAKVVVKMAIEGLKPSIPLWLTLNALGNNESWGSAGKDNAALAAYNGQFAEFVWNVADIAKDHNGKQFCAASVQNVGIMLQTGGTKPTESGTVTLYIKSIEIRPSGYVPQGTGGGSGVAGSAGASSTLTAGNAGTAGTNQ